MVASPSGAGVLSVVIPTHNRRQLVLRTLRALAKQVAGAPFEVVLVVDGSTDGTAEAVTAERWPFPLLVLEQRRSGQARARNVGAEAARGDVLVFLDDDTLPAPGFLARLAEEIRSGTDVAVGSIRLPAGTPRNVMSAQFALWREGSAERRPAAGLRFDEVLFSATAIRREWFVRLNGFDEEFTVGGAYGNEDIELGYRLQQAGAVLRHCPLATAETEVVLEAGQMLRRTRSVGRNDVRLVAKHPELRAAVFDDKRGTSTIHRLISTALLRAAWLAIPARPLRRALVWGLGRGLESHLPYRAWFALQSLEYWSAVVEAGGRELVLGGGEGRLC